MKHRLNRFLVWLLLTVLGFAVVVAANCHLDTQESVRAVEWVSPDDAVGVPGDELLGELVVHYMNIGQADATLLQGPDFTILIDAGRYEADDVVPHLHSAGVEALDLLVGTHPHADHIGQIPQVLAAFEVREVWMSGDAHTTRTFERALDAILASDADYHEPRAGEVFDFGSAQIQVVNPDLLTGDLHEGSVSMRIRFGDVSFVFTGDAEAETEQAMIARGHDVRGTVLQLGHHGSRTSSSRAFLEAVSPEIVVYSAGEGNPYGHPRNEVMARLDRMAIPVYGTDVHGTVRVVTDGKEYWVLTERSTASWAPPGVEMMVGAPVAPWACIDLNTANAGDLQHIVYIGTDGAGATMEMRPWGDLARIAGIGAGRVADIEDQGLACVE